LKNNNKKKRPLGRRKNTYEKMGLYRVFARSLEFRVDPAGQLVYFRPITELNFELNKPGQGQSPGKIEKNIFMFYYFI
jgi:hypothetical protein